MHTHPFEGTRAILTAVEAPSFAVDKSLCVRMTVSQQVRLVFSTPGLHYFRRVLHDILEFLAISFHCLQKNQFDFRSI